MGKKKEIILPFLKWAGGKRWLVTAHNEVFQESFNRYFEPFLGSGAVYFSLKPPKAVLSDANVHLIDTYRAIRDNWESVYGYLKRHQHNHSKDYYYEIRKSIPRTAATCAARFIYLNRTCWNGLYRVNLDGEFNVPVGTKSNVLLDTDDFQNIAKMLRRAKLTSCDFEATINLAEEDDLIYVDPPYTVKHNYNGFVKYNQNLFGWDDQIRLRDALIRAKVRGVKVIVSNAYHSSIRRLYNGHFVLRKICRHSVIASDKRRRKVCEEYLITG